MGALDGLPIGVPTPQGLLTDLLAKSLFKGLFGGGDGGDPGSRFDARTYAGSEDQLERMKATIAEYGPIFAAAESKFNGMPQAERDSILAAIQQYSGMQSPQGYQSGGPQATGKARWLPDGSLDMGNGMIRKPNGRIVKDGVELSAQESAKISPSIINDAMAQAGPVPVPSQPPVITDQNPIDYNRAILDLLSGLGIQKPTDAPLIPGQTAPPATESPVQPSATQLPTQPPITQVPSQPPVARPPVTQVPGQPPIAHPPPGLPAGTGTVTTPGQASTNTGESDIWGRVTGGLDNIIGILNRPTEAQPQGFSMGKLDDIFERVGNWLKTPGGQFASNVASTALGGAATIYNINEQKEAAEKMAGALDRATGVQKEMFDLTRQDLSPYRLSPAGAEASAGFQAPGGLPQVPTGAAGTPLDTSRLTDPSGAIYGGPGALPTPERSQGLTEGLPDFTNFQDPAYEWLRNEGMRTIQNAGAARGRLNSGTTLQQLNEMGVGLAGQQMDKVARMRSQLFGERLGEQQQQFGETMDLRKQLFGEGVTGSELRFGQLSDRERSQTGQQLAQFEQENLKQQQNYAQMLQLRQMLFGEQLTADEQDFLQRYNLAQLGANASMGAANAAMQQGANAGNLILGQGALGVSGAAGRAGIINDFIKTLFS